MINYHSEGEDDFFIGFNIQQGDVVKQIMTQNLPHNFVYISNSLFDTSLTFLKEEKDFLKLLELRDKTHSFIRKNKDIYSNLLCDFANWVDEDEEKNRKVIEESTEILFLAIIKKFLKLFTEHVYMESGKVDIEINHKYKNIGSLL